jgi:exopolyphosphatase/guanosine-5'-triphosphate,3'-diphosphate pyrophosphatase
MMRLSIIDLGTNTFNLLVAERDAAGRLVIVHSEEQAVFLGRGGIEQGMITSDAMERGLAVLRAFADKSRSLGAEHIMGFGTSALRNARNAQDFTSRAKRELDIAITIIPGDAEAELILEGVRQVVAFTAKPMLVMDIGGGSIEFILATDKAVMWKRSFEIGATRLLERFSPADPLSIEEYFRIAAHLDARLEPLFAVMDRHWPAALVGSAGSFDTLAELVAMERSDTLAAGEHTMAFNSTEFDAIKERLIASTRAQRAVMKAIPEYRVDTLPLALIAIERVLQHGIEELRWSKYALKEGAAWRALNGR